MNSVIEDISNQFCSIDSITYESVLNTQGIYYETLSLIDRHKITKDVLNANKAILQGSILERYTSLYGKKVLEVGSGLGVNHIVWSTKYNIDGYGVEPSQDGFNSSFQISRRLLEFNRLDPSKINNAKGENLPFQDNFFDIIFSSNVLEHTNNPESVLKESIRTLKPGGILHFVYPNYLSYYDGHYAVFHPPILSNAFFMWLIRNIYKRDPFFASTIRTELNPMWTKRTLNKLSKSYEFVILGMGEDIFLERINSTDFESWAGLYKIKSLLEIMKKLGVNRLLGKLCLLLNGYNPIILTIRKK